MSEEGFLSRWSRRKRAAEAGRPVEEAEAPAAAPAAVASPTPVAPQAAAPVAAPVAPPEEPEFDPASLPPIESLTIESDITRPSAISSGRPTTPGTSTRRTACRASRWNCRAT